MFCAFNNVNESGFQRRASHQETVNIRYLYQFIAVLLTDAASVNNADTVMLVNVALQPLPDPVMNLIDLLRGCSFASANGPHRLVG